MKSKVTHFTSYVTQVQFWGELFLLFCFLSYFVLLSVFCCCLCPPWAPQFRVLLLGSLLLLGE